MNRQCFLFLLTSVLVCFNSWSQERVLQIENKETGEKVLIQPNTKVVLTTVNNKYKGNLILPSDSLIKVGNDLFLLVDIISFQTNNRNLKKKGITLVIFGAGGVGLGCIIYTLTTISNIVNAFSGYFSGTSSNVESYALAKTIIGAGAATFVTGVVLVFRKQSYPKSAFNYQLVAG